MSKLTKEILNNLEEIEALKNTIYKRKEGLKDLSLQLTMNDFQDIDYDNLKKIYNFICYNISNDALKHHCELVMQQKKIEKYPALKKATYYPQINTLDISDEEKVKLDNIARECYGKNNITKNTFDKYGLTSEIIDIFVKLGIAKPYINFLCPRCSSAITAISKEIMDKYFRYWELCDLDNFSPEQEKEYSELEEDSEICLGCIYSECTNCDSYFGEDTITIDIGNIKEYQKYVTDGNIEESFRFKIAPDLTYENL